MAQKAFGSNEFEWKDDRLCHAPTGAFFRWANANNDSQDVWVNPGSMTDVLPDGRRYVLSDVFNEAYKILQQDRSKS
jgi:hypothetical protein